MDEQLRPGELGSIFAAFVQQVAHAAAGEKNPILERVRAHVGTDPAQLPVTAEQFDTFEQPNLQRALDAYLAETDRSAELVGVSADNKRFMALGLSDVLTQTGMPWRQISVGPVDYVNVHLADGEVLPCVQFGIYLVSAGEARIAAMLTGPSEMGDPRRQKLRLEVISARPEDPPAFIGELRELMVKLNVYRGHVISLSTAPVQIGPGPTTLVRFQTIPSITREQVVLPDGVLEG
jgi:hypothetical protein